MSGLITFNGVSHHWVTIRQVHAGQFTAQVVGLPELQASGATREDALEAVHNMVNEWVTSGRLVPIAAPGTRSLLTFSGHLDPNDPLEQEFLEELTRFRQQDLERTLREDDQECPSSSSTPTT